MQLHKVLRRRVQTGRASIPRAALPWALGRRWRTLVPYAAALVICLLAGWGGWQAALTAHLGAEKEASARRLEFFVLSLQGTLDRHEALPGLLVLDGRLQRALDDDAGARLAANVYLEAAAGAANLSAAYLMDSTGLTVAASNWNQPLTFLGHNYGFRPYVQEALGGGIGRFYGIGVTTGEAGYFLASRVRGPEGAKDGVIAIRQSLVPFEDALRQSGEAVLLVDAEGVVILSSVEAWRYRALQPLTDATRQRLARARQYGNQPLAPLVPGGGIGPGQEEVRLAMADGPADYALVRRPVGTLGWQMLILTNQDRSQQVAAIAGTAAMALSGCALGLLLHLRLTRQRREDKRAAEAALRQVNDDLERRIAQRTADVTRANAELERKVEALKRAEAILHETRDAAVQAGKLTVLGQMSAGMTHELNQPLAALHTLSDNAVNLIGQGRVPEAQENLLLISQVVERMGRIVRQLKVFARKEPAVVARVAVQPALGHALMLVEPQRREAGATIDVEPMPPQLWARADALRLEQVLVNLLRNALDAVAGQQAGRLVLRAQREGGRWRITLRDSGPGIAADVLPRLFEPFYTTKPVGQGLGLGLALSLVIAESFGGTIEARNAEGGGAEFSLVLEAA